ncbi:hypothetical protein [Maridesulfovibrio ferrireducens]|uniref:hypothetical protein n=1 Tax=Maridesulfovibrio ferrireducens TaxID=246191 RepID=UPI001A27D71B|nr:hypothetical protein [Maridesulfovibrio ferrireducens]MBI9112172.1 hypothetical protein [Maridesulfovibrio ferrireducens]
MVFLGGACMEEKMIIPETEKEILVGVLIPSGWNARFDVINLSLACDEEREVGIGNLEEHPELFNLLRRQIEVAGTVMKDGEFEIVKVVSFKVVSDSNTNK